MKKYFDKALDAFMEELANTYPDCVETETVDGEIVLKKVKQDKDCDEFEIDSDFVDRMYNILKSKYSAKDEDLIEFFNDLIKNKIIASEVADKIEKDIKEKNIEPIKEYLVSTIVFAIEGAEDE